MILEEKQNKQTSKKGETCLIKLKMWWEGWIPVWIRHDTEDIQSYQVFNNKNHMSIFRIKLN